MPAVDGRRDVRDATARTPIPYPVVTLVSHSTGVVSLIPAARDPPVRDRPVTVFAQAHRLLRHNFPQQTIELRNPLFLGGKDQAGLLLDELRVRPCLLTSAFRFSCSESIKAFMNYQYGAGKEVKLGDARHAD
jgi:hypothetical protein